MLTYWFANDKHPYVALTNGKTAATFIIRDNQIDLGSHIANTSYMVSPDYTSQGIGQLIGEYSIEEARKLGYQAMQFNIVVKSNERAVRLWQRIGFTVIGEVPDAFNHVRNGYTNAYIMYRKL